MSSNIEKNSGTHRWQGRDDTASEGPKAQRWHQQIAPYSTDLANTAAGNVLIGFCCDEGVRRNGGRIGAVAGPDGCRSALANLAWHASRPIYDAGDVHCDGEQLEAAQTLLAAQIAELLTHGHRPLVIGGGHEVAWGTWQGIAAAVGGGNTTATPQQQRVGIINIDAHFDLRQSTPASSGTPFAQIARDCAARHLPFDYLCLGVSALSNTKALFETAQQTGTQWLLDDEFVASNRSVVESCVTMFLDQVDAVYLTICLDAFHVSVAPGVSAPATRGVEVAMAEWLIDLICARDQLMVAEVAELNPRFDQDSRTAKLAARLLARCADAARPGMS